MTTNYCGVKIAPMRGAFSSLLQNKIKVKGMHLNHDFYVVLGKQCRTEKILCW